MSREWFLPVVLVAGLASANAAVVVTRQQDGETQTHVYQDGIYYDIEAGQIVNRFDFKRNRCLMINHDVRAYFEGDCEAAIKGLTDGLKAEMDRQLAALSPDERTQMESMVGAMTKGSTQVRVSFRCEGGGKVAGFDAENCLILMDESPYSSVWVSPAVAEMIGTEFDLEDFRRWDRRLREQVEVVTNQRSAQSPVVDPLAEAFDAIVAKGYPVKISPSANAGLMSMTVPSTVSDETVADTRVISIEQTSEFDAARFAPPPDYAKASSWTEFLSLDFGSARHDDHDHD